MKPLSAGERFWMLLKPDQKEIRNVYLYAIINGLVYLSLPVGIQAIINMIQVGRVNTSWIVLVAVVIIGVAINGLLQISQLRITENIQQKIFARAAFEFAYRIPRVKLKELYDYFAPELMNRFFDVAIVQKTFSKIIIDFSTASIQVLFGLILLSFYHPFFIVFSLILVVLIYAIFKFTGRKGLESSLEESKHKYKTAHWLEEIARTNITFKLAGRTDLPLDKTNLAVESYLEARETHFKILVTQYWLLVLFKVLVAAGLLIMGGILVMEQQMNIGQFVASEIVILLIMGSVEKLVLNLSVLYDMLTSIEKLAQVTDLEIESDEGIELPYDENCKGLSVEVENLVFAYKGNKQKVLNGINLQVDCGERVMITGENDSGKSTLLYLMAGLYLPDEGFVAVNGVSVTGINLESLRSVIGDCFMNELLFEGTIFENISMGRERATLDNVKWAVKNLGLESFVNQLPQGYNTVIHPQGRQFSASINSKLIIARAIADKPNLLIIKDTINALIPSQREQVMDFLVDKSNPWTLIISTNDLSVAKRMDEIVILSDGIIESKGSYESMKTKLKKYA